MGEILEVQREPEMSIIVELCAYRSLVRSLVTFRAKSSGSSWVTVEEYLVK